MICTRRFGAWVSDRNECAKEGACVCRQEAAPMPPDGMLAGQPAVMQHDTLPLSPYSSPTAAPHCSPGTPQLGLIIGGAVVANLETASRVAP